MYPDPATRAALPDDLRHAPFSNNAVFEEYTNIVLRCDKIAKSLICPDVRAEYPSMMKKMRGLLDPKLRSEVDFTEAAIDCSNVFTSWSNNVAGGLRAFIPDVNYRDKYYAALKIHACAVEEVKAIPVEYQERFGEDGYWMYNLLMANIGDRDKHSLHFVNICLGVWME